jgi:hypothetical protein
METKRDNPPDHPLPFIFRTYAQKKKRIGNSGAQNIYSVLLKEKTTTQHKKRQQYFIAEKPFICDT